MSRELSRRDVVRKEAATPNLLGIPICRAVRETIAELLYFWTRMHDSAASKIDRILHIKIVGHGNISVREINVLLCNLTYRFQAWDSQLGKECRKLPPAGRFPRLRRVHRRSVEAPRRQPRAICTSWYNSREVLMAQVC